MRFVRGSAVLAVSLVALASCGGDDDDAASSTDAPSEVSDASDQPAADGEGDEPATDGGGDDSADEAEGDEPADEAEVAPVDDPPPAENTGTVSVDGFTYELVGADFQLCETVNPAFAETINIQTSFDVDPDTITIHGDVIASRMDLGVIGDLPDEVDADVGDADLFPHPAATVDVSREGRTVSGTATVVDERVGASVTEGNPLKDTTIEFSFTC